MRETEKSLIEEMKKQLGDVTIEAKDIPKNNGVFQRGLSILKEGQDVCPILYMDHAIQEIEAGHVTVEKVAEKFVAAYEQEISGNTFEDFRNFKPTRDMILQSVLPCLVNAESNSKMLEDVPHEKFLDLAVIFRVFPKKCASFLVKNAMLQGFDLSFEELKAAAMRNAEGNTEIININDILKEDGTPVPDDGDVSMYVISSTLGVFGANVLLFTNTFRNLSEKLDADLYILPSSIHEVIVVPADGVEPERLKNMVGDVNASVVDAEEILSESVYKYSREKDEISIA